MTKREYVDMYLVTADPLYATMYCIHTGVQQCNSHHESDALSHHSSDILSHHESDALSHHKRDALSHHGSDRLSR